MHNWADLQWLAPVALCTLLIRSSKEMFNKLYVATQRI